MIIRQAPTEEERRRVRRLNLLDYFCMGVAAGILALTILSMIYGVGGRQMLELVLLLGGLLNVCLAVRAGILNLRIAAIGSLILAMICIGGVCYMVML